MVKVYLVNSDTRIHLAETKWGGMVLEKLKELGHSVVLTEEEHYPDTRGEAELARRDTLLEQTVL